MVMQEHNLKVETWSTDKVKPYKNNPRQIPQSAVDKVAASLKEFGWRQPIVVDKQGVIVVGHTRWMGAQALGMESVPVHVAKNLTAKQIKAYRIADNRVGEDSAWDTDLLKIELEDLTEGGFEPVSMGFEEVEGLQMLAGEGENDPEAEWQGMPEFNQPDATAHRQIIINFKDDEAVDEFAKLIGQEITPKARSIWHPEEEIARYADKRYVAEA